MLVFGSEKNRLLVLKGTLVTNLSTIENKTSLLDEVAISSLGISS